MLGPLPQPHQVASTIPSTSPIAQPVRQCKVAETAERVSSRAAVGSVGHGELYDGVSRTSSTHSSTSDHRPGRSRAR